MTVSGKATSIAFDVPGQTKKNVTDAMSSWTESATATPNDPNLKITYTKEGGDIGLIDIDKDTGAITYIGNGAIGKVKIRATVDDDPASGHDFYVSSFAEKEIVEV